MERGVSSPEDGEAFDEFGQLLEVLVEGAVEFGAFGEGHHLAGFTGMEIAQVVNLADVVFALAGNGCWAMASSLLVVLPIAETTTTGLRSTRDLTIPATRSMAAADSTEVPPNFMTIIETKQMATNEHE